MRARIAVARGRHEDLVAPEHRQAPGALGGVAPGLAHHRLEDGELGGDPRGGRDQRGELHAGFVVVLRAGKRC